MKDICAEFPQKTQKVSLQFVDTIGLDDLEVHQLEAEGNRLMGMGWTNDEITEELNAHADTLRTTQDIYNKQMAKRLAIMDKIDEERIGMPVPRANIDGDIGMKRLKSFLNWLNTTSPVNRENPDSISEVEILHGIQDNWTDVVDLPLTEYEFDVLSPMKIYIIGGGEAKQAEDGFWFFAG
jgi:FtsZ-binding cell division protein ZapB